MSACIRPASAGDEEVLVPMMRELYEHESVPFDEPAIRAAFRELLGDPALGGVWIVLEEGVPAGYAVATWGFTAELGGRFLLLDELLVLPEMRGRGLGHATLAFLEEEARRGGASGIRLEVATDNLRARDLYFSVGYSYPGRLFLTKRLPAPPGSRRLRSERVEAKVLVKASPERVWEALASGPGLDGWFTTGASVDARPGGRLAFRWERWGPDEFTGTYEGTVVEAEAERRFVFHWPVDARTCDTTVEIDLEARSGATLVRLVEHGFEEGPAGLREMLNRSCGWGEALALMKLFLEHGVRV